MKITILKPRQLVVDVSKLAVSAEVRYWEDALVDGVTDESGDLIPCKYGDLWRPIIDIETGKIINWNQGKSAEIHYKVCDCCTVDIFDTDGKKVAARRDDYVPKCLDLKGDGYGDYIIMKVDKNGIIENWRFTQQHLEQFEML